jgi:signal transduction histidine kinase
LINLISNAIKYNDKENIEIQINIEELTNEYQISVSDNGPGILKKHQELF